MAFRPTHIPRFVFWSRRNRKDTWQLTESHPKVNCACFTPKFQKYIRLTFTTSLIHIKNVQVRKWELAIIIIFHIWVATKSQVLHTVGCFISFLVRLRGDTHHLSLPVVYICIFGYVNQLSCPVAGNQRRHEKKPYIHHYVMSRNRFPTWQFCCGQPFPLSCKPFDSAQCQGSGNPRMRRTVVPNLCKSRVSLGSIFEQIRVKCM